MSTNLIDMFFSIIRTKKILFKSSLLFFTLSDKAFFIMSAYSDAMNDQLVEEVKKKLFDRMVRHQLSHVKVNKSVTFFSLGMSDKPLSTQAKQMENIVDLSSVNRSLWFDIRDVIFTDEKYSF